MADNKSAISPEIQAILQAVQAIALTPEKLETMLKEMKKPYVDEALQAREQRERKQMKEQFAALLENKKIQQQNCRHKDRKENWTIYPIHNFYDGQPRGICMKCDLFIQPRHIEFDANGAMHTVEAHPLFNIVLERDQVISEYAQ